MFIEIQQSKINYEIYGNGTPIIMLHGYSLDHKVLKNCMEPIFSQRGEYKRIYFDLPGMGKSPSSNLINSSDDMLEIVIGFIHEILQDQDYIIISESYGSYLARGLIARFNEKVKACMFLCPLIQPETKRRIIPEYKVFLKDEKFIATLDSDEKYEFQACVVQNERIWRRFKSDIYDPLKLRDMVFLENIFLNHYKFSSEVDNQIKRYNKPVLFIMGRQDVSAGYRDAWDLIEKYPRASFAILDMAGHNLQIEQETLFNCLTNEWLDRIEFSKKK